MTWVGAYVKKRVRDGTRANSPCVSRINTTRDSIGGRTFHREVENVEVENRRLSDESKFVIPKLKSLFEGKVLSCKGITTSRICSIVYGPDQRIL